MPRAVLSQAHQHALRRVADGATAQFPSCSAAAVAVVQEDSPILLVGTSLLSRQLEKAQWDAGQGPGVDAMHQLQVFNVSSLSAVTAWPRFAELAARRGVMSTLAAPITWRGRPLGALSLYSTELDGFAGQEVIALRWATAAALVLSAAVDSPENGTEPVVVLPPADKTDLEEAVS